MMDADFSLRDLIRIIPDHPKPGVTFCDITTMLGDARGLTTCIERLATPYIGQGVEAVAGVEARGFILGGAVAERLGCGFVPMRKKGKLPAKAIGQDYELEYGVDVIEVHEDALKKGERVLIVDDLIATGGTAEAAVKLIEALQGDLVGAAFVIELPELGGRARLEERGVDCHALMAF